MNDQVNGYDHTQRYHQDLSTVGGLMALSDNVDVMDSEDTVSIRHAVDYGQMLMTHALVAWLVGAYNLGLIDIFQLTDGVQSVVSIHEQVLATLYEYVFGAVPEGSVEELMS
jgi:hypothetical protein